MKKVFTAAVVVSLLASCTVSEKSPGGAGTAAGEVNVYSHRHYDVDKEIFAAFEKETGIKVNVIEDDADKLIVRLKNEGENSPCDVFITADAGRLIKAKEEGLLQSVTSEILNRDIPASLRDSDNQWFGLTQRARVIVYDKTRVNPEQLSGYEDLASPRWKGKLLMRSSDNVYNQSLVAALIAHLGTEKTLEWAKGVTRNFAREPKGGDRDQVQAIAAGTGDIAVVNTYYIGKMLHSSNAEEVKAAQGVAIFFPNQQDRGTHINISGAGVARNAPNKANAVKLLEFLLSDNIQQKFAEANFEYPVKPGVPYSSQLTEWGEFKKDSLPLSNLSKYNTEALRIFNEAGWK